MEFITKKFEKYPELRHLTITRCFADTSYWLSCFDIQELDHMVNKQKIHKSLVRQKMFRSCDKCRVDVIVYFILTEP